MRSREPLRAGAPAPALHPSRDEPSPRGRRRRVRAARRPPRECTVLCCARGRGHPPRDGLVAPLRDETLLLLQRGERAALDRPVAQEDRASRRRVQLRDAACPLSTRGGTRLVRLVRGRGGGGGGGLAPGDLQNCPRYSLAAVSAAHPAPPPAPPAAPSAPHETPDFPPGDSSASASAGAPRRAPAGAPREERRAEVAAMALPRHAPGPAPSCCSTSPGPAPSCCSTSPGSAPAQCGRIPRALRAERAEGPVAARKSWRSPRRV